MAWRSASAAIEMALVLLHLVMDAKNEEGDEVQSPGQGLCHTKVE